MEYIARIQQKTFKDLKQPYPYFISADGLVGRQDFWNGKPYRLLGFNNKPQPGEISLPFREFVNDMKLAIGSYPVFEDKNGDIKTHINPVVNTDMISGIFKNTTKEEFEEFEIAEKACWFSRMMLKWWEKDKKIDDESTHNMRKWPGMLSIMKWENNDFKNHNEMVEFFELMSRWWERDTPIHEKPEYNHREWVGTHFIRDWCRKELTK